MRYEVFLKLYNFRRIVLVADLMISWDVQRKKGRLLQNELRIFPVSESGLSPADSSPLIIKAHLHCSQQSKRCIKYDFMGMGVRVRGKPLFFWLQRNFMTWKVHGGSNFQKEWKWHGFLSWFFCLFLWLYVAPIISNKIIQELTCQIFFFQYGNKS